MVKSHRMIRFRAIFTGLFLLLHKVCFASTAKFNIIPYYEKYYGFQSDPKATDKIFFRENGGLRVECKASIMLANGVLQDAEATWYELKNDQNIEVTIDARQSVYATTDNSTLILTRSACTKRLIGRQFVCGCYDSGRYPQYSTPQYMEMSYINKFIGMTKKNLTTVQGEKKFLSCSKPNGIPEPDIYWTHNGSRLDVTLRSGNILPISSPRFKDAGEYQCFATNPAGTVEAPVTNLIVIPRTKGLSFLKPPTDVTAQAGENVTLSCVFNRKPSDFGWLFKPNDDNVKKEEEKEKIASGKWIQLETDLVIVNLDRNDSGQYTCYGRDDSNNIVESVEVTVIYFDKSVARSPKDQTVVVDERVEVTCTGPASYPKSELTLYKGDKKITEKGYNVEITQKDNVYSVVFNKIQLADSGTYICYSNNPQYDTWKSKSAYIKVKEDGIKAEDFLPQRNYNVNIGDDVTLLCSAVVDPFPIVSWYHRGNHTRISQQDKRFQFKLQPSARNRWNATMKIKNINLNDHKTSYYCKMKNRLGSSQSPVMTVLVNHIKCVPTKRHQVKYFKIQEPYEIACPLPYSAHPNAPISWLYNKNASSFRQRGSSLYTDSLTEADRIEYTCKTTNSAGVCVYVIEVQPQRSGIQANGSADALLIIIISIVGVLAVVICIFALYFFFKKRITKKKIESNEALERLNQPVFSANANGYDDAPAFVLTPSPTSNLTHNQLYGTLSKFQAWQIARNRLRNLSILGEGQFGSVYKAELKSLDGSPSTLVAIKQIKDDQNVDAVMDYEKEMLMMTQLQHPNIIKLIGVCTDASPYFIVTEFMEKGNLSNFLQDVVQSKTERLSLDDQICICIQISSGLQYMAEKKYVHRDVAARNCLVGANLLVKVADFGLSRNVGGREIYQKDGGTVPIRWMSPEAIQYGQYTTANDVWAYGVTVWEVFSYGVIPYSAWSNEDVAINVQAGSRLLKPDNCPQSVYNIMCLCWNEYPEHRPDFGEILADLEAV